METEGLEKVIDKETAKLAGRLMIPVYGALVMYNEFLNDSLYPKPMTALASLSFNVAVLGLELNLIYGVMYRITH